MDDAGVAHHYAGLLLAGFIFAHDDALVKAVLAAVRLVGHDDDVSPGGQRLLPGFEFEHRGEDDAVGLAPIQQAFQVDFALGLHRRLPQEGSTPGELGIELVVQVDAVSHDHDGRAVQRRLQQMGIEHHGQRLAAALRMPEHAALAVRGRGYLRLFNGAAHGEILMIAGEDLYGVRRVVGKQYEVLDDVQQPVALEHTLIEGVELGKGCVLVAAVLGLPLHEAVQPGSDGSGLVGAQVADDAEGIVIKHAGDVLHVVADLVIGVLRADLVLGWRFQLDQHQRQAVDEYDDVRAAIVAVLHIGKLVDRIKGVAIDVLIVHQIHEGVALFAFDIIAHGDAVLQIVHEYHVLLQLAAGFEVFKLCDGLVDGLDGQALVQLHKAVPQHRLQDGAGVIAVDVRAMEEGIAQVLEDLQYGLLKGILGERHDHHSLCGVGIVYYRLSRMTNVDFK